MQYLAKAEERSNLAVVSAALACGLLFGGCDTSKSAPPPPAAPEVAIVNIRTERVVLTTDLPGRTSAYAMAEIRPQVGGLIQKRLFEEGAEIKVGQVLYQIDPAPLQAAYDNAAANLATARKAADRARAALAVSRAGVVRQRAVLENARTNRKRFEDLLADGAVSATQRDQAVTDADVAEATLRLHRGAGGQRPGSGGRGRGVHPAGGGGTGDGPNQSGIRPRHRAHCGPHREIQRDRGGPSHGEPGHPFATIQQLDPIYVDVTQSSANLLRLRQKPSERPAQGQWRPAGSREAAAGRRHRPTRWRGR